MTGKTLLARPNPADAYRRVDFEARVSGADPTQLVVLCYERLIAALGSAQFAHNRGDNRAKSQALTRALAAITALQLGVSGRSGVASALASVYEAARRAILESVVTYDDERLTRVRSDFVEIAAAVSSHTNLR